MEKMLAVDPEKCTGCRLCETACSMHHEKVCAPEKARIHVAKWENQGIYIPIVCQQCADPVCETVCTMGAIRKDRETGAITIDQSTCVGCRLCAQFCPFGGIVLDSDTKKAVKCDLCNGDPVCVRFCEPEALQYLESTKLSMKKRRAAAERFSEHLKKMLASF